MTAAIFALIGVVVGGLLGLVSDVYRDRRREIAELRTAARMASLDLGVFLTIGQGHLDLGRGWPTFEFALTDGDHAASLAAQLSNQDAWESLEGGLLLTRTSASGYRAGEALTEERMETLRSNLASVKEAQAILSGLSRELDRKLVKIIGLSRVDYKGLVAKSRETATS